MTAKNIKDKSIKIRLTQEEKTEIQARAGAINISTYLRKLALNQPVPQPPPPTTKTIIHTADPELIRAVAWIGNNMNQIAKHLNSGNATDNSMLLQMIEIQRALDAELKRVIANDS